jgi:hypothetical protein
MFSGIVIHFLIAGEKWNEYFSKSIKEFKYLEVGIRDSVVLNAINYCDLVFWRRKKEIITKNI